MEWTAEDAAEETGRMASILENPQLQVALEAVRGELGKQAESEFAEGHDPDGEMWPISWRAAREGGKTLVETGLLYLSVIDSIANAAIDSSSLSYPAEAGLPEYGPIQEAEHYGEVHRHVFKYNRPTEKISVGYHVVPARPFSGFGQATIDFAENAGLISLNEQLLDA